MQSKERIPRILNKLKTYWTENQNLRLGQIISNFSVTLDNRTDPFHMSDEEFEEALDEEIDEPELFFYEDEDILIYLKEHFNLDSKQEAKIKAPYIIKWLLQNEDLKVMENKGGNSYGYIDLDGTIKNLFNALSVETE